VKSTVARCGDFFRKNPAVEEAGWMPQGTARGEGERKKEETPSLKKFLKAESTSSPHLAVAATRMEEGRGSVFQQNAFPDSCQCVIALLSYARVRDLGRSASKLMAQKGGGKKERNQPPVKFLAAAFLFNPQDFSVRHHLPPPGHRALDGEEGERKKKRHLRQRLAAKTQRVKYSTNLPASLILDVSCRRRPARASSRKGKREGGRGGGPSARFYLTRMLSPPASSNSPGSSPSTRG